MGRRSRTSVLVQPSLGITAGSSATHTAQENRLILSWDGHTFMPQLWSVTRWGNKSPCPPLWAWRNRNGTFDLKWFIANATASNTYWNFKIELRIRIHNIYKDNLNYLTLCIRHKLYPFHIHCLFVFFWQHLWHMSFQARNRIPDAEAVTLQHSCHNTGSLTHCVGPEIQCLLMHWTEPLQLDP